MYSMGQHRCKKPTGDNPAIGVNKTYLATLQQSPPNWNLVRPGFIVHLAPTGTGWAIHFLIKILNKYFICMMYIYFFIITNILTYYLNNYSKIHCVLFVFKIWKLLTPPLWSQYGVTTNISPIAKSQLRG